MKKRILSIILTLALCLSLLPAAAFAAGNSATSVTVGGVEIAAAGYYPITDGKPASTPVEQSAATNSYIHWDNTNRILTLSGATITGVDQKMKARAFTMQAVAVRPSRSSWWE